MCSLVIWIDRMRLRHLARKNWSEKFSGDWFLNLIWNKKACFLIVLKLMKNVLQINYLRRLKNKWKSVLLFNNAESTVACSEMFHRGSVNCWAKSNLRLETLSTLVNPRLALIGAGQENWFHWHPEILNACKVPYEFIKNNKWICRISYLVS